MRDDPITAIAPGRGQLALPFRYRPRYAAFDFLAAASNEAARLWLGRPGLWPDGRLVLWGPPGCGKTHLLHIWAAEAGAAVLSAATVGDLTGAARSGALAIDDADRARDEAMLLHALNVAAAAGRPVLLAARKAPSAWPVALDDLASRVRAAPAVVIGKAEDSLLAALLARLLAEHQLVVGPGVQDWLLNRLPRSPDAICAAVARLDAIALAAGRSVSRDLAADALAAMPELADRAADPAAIVP